MAVTGMLELSKKQNDIYPKTGACSTHNLLRVGMLRYTMHNIFPMPPMVYNSIYIGNKRVASDNGREKREGVDKKNTYTHTHTHTHTQKKGTFHAQYVT